MASSGLAILLVMVTLSGFGSTVLGAITFKIYYRQLDGDGNITGYEAADPPAIQVGIGLTSLQFVTVQQLADLRKLYAGSRKRIIFVAYDVSKNKFVAGKFKRFDSKIPRPFLKNDEAAVEFFFLSRFSDYVRIVPTWDIAHKENTTMGHKIKTALTPKKKLKKKY